MSSNAGDSDSDDSVSWGSDFDDVNYSREIEDNIINEDLEAQLNRVLSLSSGNNTSLPESSSAPAAENTDGNVNVNGNVHSGFSYIRSNDISALISHRIINKCPGNQRTPELSTTPVQERMAGATSSHSLAASNQVTESISQTRTNNIPTVCPDNKQTPNQNSELNRGSKTPGKLKADAFAFLKNIPSGSSANDDRGQDKGRKSLVATAFAHAIKLEQQNLSKNSAINVSQENYEWANPIPSAPRLSFSSDADSEEDLRFNLHSLHNSSESDNLRNTGNIPTFKTTKSRETPEVSKPPLPSRPPPIFALGSGKSVKANISVTSGKLQVPIPDRKLTKPAPTEVNSSLQVGDQRTSVGKLTAVVKGKSLEDRLQESFRPVPLTAPSLYPIIDESEPLSGNENAATSSPKISVAPPLPKTKPKQGLHMHLSKDGNQSQTGVQWTPAVKSPFGNLQERNEDHKSFETKQNKTDGDINVPKFRRSLGSSMEILSEAKQPCPSSSIIQAADMQRKSQPSKPISPIDEENWSNYLNRPQLPQKLKQTHRSLSCSSLVQSFKEMSFPKRNQTEKVKKLSESSSPPPRITEAPKPFPRPSKEDVAKYITRNAWFHDVNAVQAQTRLLKMKQNGAFLVRHSSNPTNEIPFTMCVAVNGRVLNSHIRLKSNGYYALGKEKRNEKTFSTITDLIKYHQEVPIEICPSGTETQFHVCLLVTPPKEI